MSGEQLQYTITYILLLVIRSRLLQTATTCSLNQKITETWELLYTCLKQYFTRTFIVSTSLLLSHTVGTTEQRRTYCVENSPKEPSTLVHCRNQFQRMTVDLHGRRENLNHWTQFDSLHKLEIPNVQTSRMVPANSCWRLLLHSFSHSLLVSSAFSPPPSILLQQ